MRHLLLSTSCFVAFASPLHAQSTISTANASPVKTSTVKAGLPDDIIIASSGTIIAKVPASVLVDSNNTVTNQGTLAIDDRSSSTAILVNAGLTSTIVNSGTIRLDETYAAADSDGDGDADGVLSKLTARYAIRTLGAMTGDVRNTGTISVEGNDSAAIWLAGPLTGSLATDGKISVSGERSVGVGVGSVTGPVRIAGALEVAGKDASAFVSTGAIGGSLVLQGTISATGYRKTAISGDQSKLDADDLLQSRAAVSVGGDVAGGIIVAIAPANKNPNDADEDDDGIEDAKEGNGRITSYGSAAALSVASVSDIVVGPVTGGTGAGLIVDGELLGDALHAGFSATAVQLGGLGGDVSIAGGITVGSKGKIFARSVDKSATALNLADGTNAPSIVNRGQISAATGGKTVGVAATAIAIDDEATVTSLFNGGTIQASVGSGAATASAIDDSSGLLAFIDNRGVIVARGSTASGGNVAIDLSANTSGATIRQTRLSANGPAPYLGGTIRLGSGSDTLDIRAGSQQGDVLFGAGSNRYLLSGNSKGAGRLVFGGGNDHVLLSGTARHAGTIDFGGGSDMFTLRETASFTGQLLGATGTAVSLADGTLELIGANEIGSLTANDGTIVFHLDGAADATTLEVLGSATFTGDTRFVLALDKFTEAEGSHVLLSAAHLTGAQNIDFDASVLPFLFDSEITVGADAISVSVVRKSAAELGLSGSQAAAYSAFFEALDADAGIAATVLAATNGEEVAATFRQMLPDHAGGAFEAVTMGDRTAARLINEREMAGAETGKTGYWLGQFAFGASKALGETGGYALSGWGAAGGGDIRTPLGRIGASALYLFGDNDDRGTQNGLTSQHYGAALHWRVATRGIEASARGGLARVAFDSRRAFRSALSGVDVERTSEARWMGSLVSAGGHLAYRHGMGRLFLQPAADLDYHRLIEAAHTETGGGEGFDLIFDQRRSSELAASLMLSAGLEFGGKGDSGYSIAIEGGRREILSGTLGSTTAQFANGEKFTLTPDPRQSGYLARLRMAGGGNSFKVSAELGAEEREERLAYDARMALNFGF